ncbi:helix-turn-helix transcriptional regulator [Rhodococcus phenolicus]|uniref:helix-turn-helix transcriptional regulator n=1 Tax=Rhodococcus phenolicus TaxID=263849 RepID=UPI0009EE06AF|nr:helix-turn-helix domain-containing protein [Rhodococcus phenolicus]
MATSSRLLTLQEAADALRINKRTLRRLAAEGRIPLVRVSDRVIRVRADVIDAIIEGAV